MSGQGFAPVVPRVVEPFGRQLQAQGVDEMVGQHANEQMAFHPPLDLVVNRPQSQIRFQTAKHRFQIGQCVFRTNVT
ncbi:hypothetical protein C7C56_007910, partial [Massilia glaciei]